jgi:hypothetical protein
MISTNDIKEMLLSDLSKSYEIDKDEEIIIVKTPLRYDDGDYAVVFIAPQPNEEFILDDNGDAATRLMFEGVDIDSQLVQTWLRNTSAIYNIEWDAKCDKLWCKVHFQNLVEKVICMAQVSVQMQTLTAVVLKSEEQVEQVKKKLKSEKEIKAGKYTFPIIRRNFIRKIRKNEINSIFNQNTVLAKVSSIKSDFPMFSDFTVHYGMH